MTRQRKIAILTDGSLVLTVCLTVAGCAQRPAEAPASLPISVTVSYPVERPVTDHADFTARTAAVDSVQLRARVWGYLDKVYFKEGAMVKTGDVLFEIDPRIYRVTLDQAEGNLLVADLPYNIEHVEAILNGTFKPEFWAHQFLPSRSARPRTRLAIAGLLLSLSCTSVL